jgi:hypothetical protein
MRSGVFYAIRAEGTAGTVTHEERVSRVEAGSNTSTVALRVVGGDENGSLESDSKIWS